MQGKKIVAKKTINIETQIGVDNVPIEIDFDNGVSIKVLFKIVPSDKEGKKAAAGGTMYIKGGPSE